MKAQRVAGYAAVATLLLGCVTINVYFPAAAAQEAADRIIQDVYGETPGQGGGQAPQSPPEAAPESGDQSALEVLLLGALDLLVAPAAAQADINIQTPAIERLRASLKARHELLEPYYRSGAVGMTGDGFVEARDLKAVPLAERRRVQQLVAEENADREAMYAEIARANGHPEWRQEIQATFARRWVSNAPGGWWYQNDQGQWTRK